MEDIIGHHFWTTVQCTKSKWKNHALYTSRRL